MPISAISLATRSAAPRLSFPPHPPASRGVTDRHTRDLREYDDLTPSLSGTLTSWNRLPSPIPTNRESTLRSRSSARIAGGMISPTRRTMPSACLPPIVGSGTTRASPRSPPQRSLTALVSSGSLTGRGKELAGAVQPECQQLRDLPP